MSTARSASITLSAPISLVHATLLAPGAYPRWNPAFRAVGGNSTATVGDRHTLTVRPGLTGHFWYETIAPERVVTCWEVPGFAERGIWELSELADGTRVAHGFDHAGLLAAALAPAYRDVAEARLDRLAEYIDRAVPLPQHISVITPDVHGPPAT